MMEIEMHFCRHLTFPKNGGRGASDRFRFVYSPFLRVSLFLNGFHCVTATRSRFFRPSIFARLSSIGKKASGSACGSCRTSRGCARAVLQCSLLE